ncbi:EVE domain-containing protein [Parvibaculum sp.]|jgi:predicted RNA-binding protein with PUA-like domain|uniref:EVE domain-containing protein n=1 Tax=Parvibaculum sp. TaxID=2024848 RepID=UPI000C39070F|nr:EVE domain-containing protein [Parvibaculum sp.]HAC60306.1 EVE domain-containing protein [Rhodobiaceae bacterium]MAU61129.1 ubiquinol-cytochrome C reductase [Parvibaculum sp.]MBO6669623.1 EVE domain-containing protein [Parvibaculum sp.]MBO6693588.1 EVE domain-containing protein [Parvibaculum sp.]MBO6716079.1 EVE domain-containing protein [Parvibaculum sp.]|tara:strand:+ start:5695 stop:6120 length:426 start_codon:yes stop_codon:yes gene_type:complete
MAYWLFKSEPSTWSWEDQKKKGKKGEPWNGVRNYQANNNMKAMKKGDYGFFYHSVDEKRIVGIVRVIGEHRPDPTDEKGKFGLVDIEAVEDMPKPVTLEDVKNEPALHEMALLKQSRLSVQPVRADEWKLICRMGGLKKAP